MPAWLIWLAMVFGPSLLVLLWLRADEWLACEPEDEGELEPNYAANVAARWQG